MIRRILLVRRFSREYPLCSETDFPTVILLGERPPLFGALPPSKETTVVVRSKHLPLRTTVRGSHNGDGAQTYVQDVRY